MNKKSLGTWVLTLMVLSLGSVATANPNDAPSVEEQIAGLQQMCADTADARAQRQAEKPLYDRLGGYDKIESCIEEVVRLHFENPALDRIMTGIDGEKLAKNVTDFVSTGTGGPKVYTGRDLPTAHARLHLTDSDFLAAGGDIVQAMQTMEYGQNEIDEFVCILVSMKDLVVLE
jgi:hemoglobin